MAKHPVSAVGSASKAESVRPNRTSFVLGLGIRNVMAGRQRFPIALISGASLRSASGLPFHCLVRGKNVQSLASRFAALPLLAVVKSNLQGRTEYSSDRACVAKIDLKSEVGQAPCRPAVWGRHSVCQLWRLSGRPRPDWKVRRTGRLESSGTVGND